VRALARDRDRWRTLVNTLINFNLLTMQIISWSSCHIINK
jgi:hypothetical protein